MFFYEFKVMDFVIVEIRKRFFNTIYVEFMKKHLKMKSVPEKSLNLFPMIWEFELRNYFELFCNISSVWLQLAKANLMSGKLVLRKRKLGLLLNTHSPILPIAVCLSTMIHIHMREFILFCFVLIFLFWIPIHPFYLFFCLLTMIHIHTREFLFCFVLNTHSTHSVCLSTMIHIHFILFLFCFEYPIILL